jgi:hypothetical protein
MIFLSSQPDDYFFLWQLELQIHNFIAVGIEPKNIHILIGYNANKGLLKEYQDFIKLYKDVNIHAYTDTRKSKLYAPSLRWHIIAKHLKTFPFLQQSNIFHHDSDIIFTHFPDFSTLKKDDVWYVSDTKSYLDSNYIKGSAGIKIFEKMCKVIGVTTEQVENDDANAGGAQYILKNMKIEFLEKMEKDSERMFRLLVNENRKLKKSFCDNTKESSLIQAWTADMWVIWWNALLIKQPFKVHAELDFAWADNSINKLDTCRILHYTGSVAKDNVKIFRKGDYVNYSPYYADLSKIDENFCSWHLKILIQDYLNCRNTKRANLTDISFLIPVKIDSEDDLENIYTVINYFTMNFKTNIFLTEVGKSPKIDISEIPADVSYHFVKDDKPELECENYYNQMALNVATPYIALYRPDVIFSVSQIIKSVKKLRKNKRTIVVPFDGNIFKIDPLLKAMFIKLQDVNLFEENQGKLIATRCGLECSVLFFNRQDYVGAMPYIKDIHILNWSEAESLLAIYNLNLEDVKGKLYHLAHSQANQ